jgi:hypothetical protein
VRTWVTRSRGTASRRPSVRPLLPRALDSRDLLLDPA